jgi:hypothetical protein
MTAVTTFPVSEPDDGADGTTHRYTVGITGTGLSNSYLCLLYAVTPVPPPLRGDGSLHEGVDVALAVDQRRHVYRSGRSAYRTSAWQGRGQVRVLFPPFADTPGFEEILCEACVVIDAKRVRSTSIRGV